MQSISLGHDSTGMIHKNYYLVYKNFSPRKTKFPNFLNIYRFYHKVLATLKYLRLHIVISTKYTTWLLKWAKLSYDPDWLWLLYPRVFSRVGIQECDHVYLLGGDPHDLLEPLEKGARLEHAFNTFTSFYSPMGAVWCLIPWKFIRIFPGTLLILLDWPQDSISLIKSAGVGAEKGKGRIEANKEA